MAGGHADSFRFHTCIISAISYVIPLDIMNGGQSWHDFVVSCASSCDRLLHVAHLFC